MFNAIKRACDEPVASFLSDAHSRWIQLDGHVVGVFLTPNTRYCIRLKSGNVMMLTTAACNYPQQVARFFITPYHLQSGVIDLITRFSSEEYLFTDLEDICFWEELFVRGFFALPHGDIVLVPNPQMKFGIQIITSTILKTTKKMKPHSFSFVPLQIRSQNRSELRKYLITCREWHIKFGRNRSTWISEKFIETVVRMVDESPRIRMHVFTLIDIESQKLAAVSIGFRTGNAFMDFTACTLLRDKRSCGKLLLSLECEWLRSQGVTFWYLGFKLEYMRSLSECFKEYDREMFQRLWNESSFI